MGEMADMYLDQALEHDLVYGEDYYEDGPVYTNSSRSSHKRACTRCSEEFKSPYPCACPYCGGWTDKI